MSSVLNELITLLTDGISGMASGLGSGLQALVSNIFLETTGTGSDATTTLSTFGGVIVIFGAVALAIGLSKFIVNWLTSWGN